MTRDEAIPVLNWLVAVPTTSTVRNIASQVQLDRSDGMPGECALTFDNIRVIRKAHPTRQITTLSTHRWPEVCEALNITLLC
jgi:mRNA-degrading endonuclease toxin of MazEF toxin-antitoxin module